jgi:hypothetical protein
MSSLNFDMALEAPVGRFITFTLFKNGVATPWRVTGNGAGTGNPVAVSMTALDYADPAAYYEIFATAEVANTNTRVSNGGVILSVLPVNIYI